MYPASLGLIAKQFAASVQEGLDLLRIAGPPVYVAFAIGGSRCGKSTAGLCPVGGRRCRSCLREQESGQQAGVEI